MSLLAMPFLVINYGGEMIYILEQRLHSQQIKQEKAQKVLHDLSRALFNEAFVNELLRPQPLYSFPQTREVCDKLAQSSIMKLSADSMDKLFDLVVMGVKYQTLSVRHPCELIDITLNHVDYIANLVKGSGTSADIVAKARDNFCRFAKELSLAEYAQVRMALLDFALHKRVKVSLFLQEKMQHGDGRFVIQAGGPLPNEELARVPGKIIYEGGETGSFDYPLASALEPKLTGNPYDPDTRDSSLGHNLYTVDRKKSAPQKAVAPPPSHGQAGSSKAASASSSAVSSGAAELNSLGSMLGVSSGGAQFKVNLFDRPGDATAPSGTEQICIPRMTREELEKCNRELVEVMAGMDVAQGDSQPADLGDLYDQVAGGD
eukprot:TRINITY_DN1188_c0_g1_i1.p1 TRINITY_DN1188_c0_g1~~TRINITY_DN1188_c0_g1_i1.p1  ORF type:complete len:375 (+),score=110.82 TRINITY_DN1188_c0_g1_i1:115-1239(+)